MVPDFTIRKANSDDVLGMMEVEQAGFPANFHEPEEMFRDIVDNAPENCYVAEYDNTVIGYLLAHPSEEDREDYQGGYHHVRDTDVMFLHDLCVNPKIQSKGVGRALFEYFENDVKANHFNKVVGIAVGDAAPYWKKLGFTMVRPYSYNGEPGQYMVKEI